MTNVLRKKVRGRPETAILMGQGYKRDHLDAAPENIKKLARINSGYNEAKAELHELEHQLTYCVIKAPVSGYVSKIQNTLYGAAQPGEYLNPAVHRRGSRPSRGERSSAWCIADRGG